MGADDGYPRSMGLELLFCTAYPKRHEFVPAVEGEVKRRLLGCPGVERWLTLSSALLGVLPPSRPEGK